MFYDRFGHIHGEALGCWTMKFDFISHTHTLSLSFHAPVPPNIVPSVLPCLCFAFRIDKCLVESFHELPTISEAIV